MSGPYSLPPGAYNLPPGVTLQDLDPLPVDDENDDRTDPYHDVEPNIHTEPSIQ